MTTEILRNTLVRSDKDNYEHSPVALQLSIDELAFVVFDEVHYIADDDRGGVWEQTMSLLPKEVQMVMLSATLDRPAKLASWLSTRHAESRNVTICSSNTQLSTVPLRLDALRWGA